MPRAVLKAHRTLARQITVWSRLVNERKLQIFLIEAYTHANAWAHAVNCLRVHVSCCIPARAVLGVKPQILNPKTQTPIPSPVLKPQTLNPQANELRNQPVASFGDEEQRGVEGLWAHKPREAQ